MHVVWGCINLSPSSLCISVLQCENMNDAEQLTWLLVNHIEEVVSLSAEPPVQELIAAVHRNPVASGLLVQAVGARCQNLRQVWYYVIIVFQIYIKPLSYWDGYLVHSLLKTWVLFKQKKITFRNEQHYVENKTKIMYLI